MDQISKNAVISRRILEEIGKGKSVKEAMDTLFGDGVYDQLVTDLYHGLRGEAVPG